MGCHSERSSGSPGSFYLVALPSRSCLAQDGHHHKHLPRKQDGDREEGDFRTHLVVAKVLSAPIPLVGSSLSVTSSLGKCSLSLGNHEPS